MCLALAKFNDIAIHLFTYNTNLQINKIDAKLALANDDSSTMARLLSLRESLKVW